VFLSAWDGHDRTTSFCVIIWLAEAGKLRRRGKEAPCFLEHFAGIVRLSLPETAGFAGENAGAGQISLTKL
jgi:hypothetical protein